MLTFDPFLLPCHLVVFFSDLYLRTIRFFYRGLDYFYRGLDYHLC